MSDSDESDLDDYFSSFSGSETSEYDITSDEEDFDCDYSLKDARCWVPLVRKKFTYAVSSVSIFGTARNKEKYSGCFEPTYLLCVIF
ncbi:hypothetical protein TNCT_628551 [Trichonephila clavata]|uniref:Uncharacterized protein n=1 Tax=Trichonephila clavata TaxID=2740835 RepID=A0A8X6J4X8_TRICU|nr:hypothetical protein TNCT_628551 [Trichonephila clavata]